VVSMSLQHQPCEGCQVAQVQLHRRCAVFVRIGLEDQVPVGCRPALITWNRLGPSCSNDRPGPGNMSSMMQLRMLLTKATRG